jgi:hypothetical protein
MKKVCFFIGVTLLSLLGVQPSFAQAPIPYKLPDAFKFDYQVSQVITEKQKTADRDTLQFFYTQSGEYAAASVSGREGMKGNLLMILTRDGICIFFNEKHKNITIVSIRKLLSDMSGFMKWIRIDSLMSGMRAGMNQKDFKSAKTGTTKTLFGYSTEEYSVSDRKGQRGSVWFTKVDFNGPADYIFDAVGASYLKMMGAGMSDRPLLQALTRSKTLITEIDLKDSTGTKAMQMQTIQIGPFSKTVSISGYQVNDYSNMTAPEIFRAEMKKRN